MVEHMDIDEDVGMEVDKVYGEIVGTIDVVIPKQSSVPTFGILTEANSVTSPASDSNLAEVPSDSDINNVPLGFGPSTRYWL